MLVVGSRWFIDSTVVLATLLGVSELVIGLILVAAGTSLPELTTSIVASIRKERDIAVGNVVGSNIFNVLAVLGFSSALSPEGGLHVSEIAIRFDIPFMIAISVACLPIFFTGHIISRWEGVLFLLYYFFYTSFLVFTSSRPVFLEKYSIALFYFAFPIIVLTLFIISSRAIRYKKKNDILDKKDIQ